MIKNSSLDEKLQGLGARFPRKMEVPVVTSVIFAISLLLIGTICLWIASQIENKWSKAPNWIIGALGCFFLFWMIYFLINIAKLFQKEKRHKQLLEGYPTGQWCNDYYWDPKGTLGESDADIAGSFGAIIISLIFSFLFFALFRAHQDKISFLGFLLFALLALSCVSFFLFIHETIKAIRNKQIAGKTYLSFPTFPFFIGSAIQATLLLEFNKDVEKITATLRCRSEYYAEKTHYWLLVLGKLPMKETVLKQEEHYTKTITINEPYRKEKGQIPITFDLPEDAMCTSLSSEKITYWELVVTVDLMFQISFRKVFLIPVYHQN